MPLIQVKLIEGAFSQAQKKEIIQKFTDTMVSIEGKSIRPVTWVILEEVKSDERGIGGKEMTTYSVQVKVIEEALSQGQKQQVIQKFTDTMASIEGKSMRPANFVKIEEVKSGEWGIGGQAMTKYDIMALAAESYEKF
jgi:4-oxalocrotonate tautomerase